MLDSELVKTDLWLHGPPFLTDGTEFESECVSLQDLLSRSGEITAEERMKKDTGGSVCLLTAHLEMCLMWSDGVHWVRL